jgi:hypothetical protein
MNGAELKFAIGGDSYLIGAFGEKIVAIDHLPSVVLEMKSTTESPAEFINKFLLELKRVTR